MLGERRVGPAVRTRNGRTIPQSPHLWMAAASHRSVDGDPAARIADDRDGACDGARHDACGQYDSAGFDRAILEPHTTGLDRPDRGRDLYRDSAALEHARGRRRELVVDLWQNSRARFEQPKADII